MGIEEFVLNRERRVGMAITRNERDLAFTKNLLEQTDFSEEKIANLADVNIEFVRKVKASLK